MDTSTAVTARPFQGRAFPIQETGDMMHADTDTPALFHAEVVRIHMQVTWDQNTGWRVHAVHRHEGEEVWGCPAFEQARLDLAELLTAVELVAREVRGF